MCAEAGVVAVQGGGDVFHAVHGEIHGCVEYGEPAVYCEDSAGAGENGHVIKSAQKKGTGLGEWSIEIVSISRWSFECTILHYEHASGGLAILCSARRSSQVVSGLSFSAVCYGIWVVDSPPDL